MTSFDIWEWLTLRFVERMGRADNDVDVQRDVVVEMTVSTVISTAMSDSNVSGDSHFLPWNPIQIFGDSRENLFESHGVTFL